MTDVTQQAKDAVELVKSEVPFVKANWAKMGAAVIAVFVLGVLAGHIFL